MGRKQKFVSRKNEERKRQSKKINKIGRPHKVKWLKVTQDEVIPHSHQVLLVTVVIAIVHNNYQIY